MKRILLISAAMSLASGAALAGGPLVIVSQHPVSTVAQTATATAIGGSASASHNHNGGLGVSAALSGFNNGGGNSGNSTSGSASGAGGNNNAFVGGVRINQDLSATSSAAATMSFGSISLIR